MWYHNTYFFVVVCSAVWPELSVTFTLAVEVRAARSRSSESHRLLPGSVGLMPMRAVAYIGDYIALNQQLGDP